MSKVHAADLGSGRVFEGENDITPHVVWVDVAAGRALVRDAVTGLARFVAGRFHVERVQEAEETTVAGEEVAGVDEEATQPEEETQTVEVQGHEVEHRGELRNRRRKARL